jgi:hypothetical protein
MITNRRQFIARAGVFALAARTDAVSAEQPPRSLPDFYLGHPGHQHYIREPGLYGLDRDIVVRKSWGLTGHSGPNGGIVIQLGCGGVEVDLGGHSITVRHGLAGIALAAQSNRELAGRFVHERAGVDNRHVTLRNGTIDLSDDERGDEGVCLVDAWTRPTIMTLARGGESRELHAPPDQVDYRRNEYLVEKLRVLSNGLGVALEGSHNALRDCVVESSGNVAVFCAGPDNLIENCDIRLRALKRSPESEGSPLRGAIVLRDGSNTVIRNCRIRVDKGGLPSDTRCIRVRDGATNVTVEDCTFINVEPDDWITAMDGAEVTSRGNRTEHRWQPW